MILDNAKAKSRGSMGIPSDISPDKVFNKDTPPEAAVSVDDGFSFGESPTLKAGATSAPEPAITSDRMTGAMSLEGTLKSLGITLSDDDLLRYVYRGSLEKTFVLYKFKSKEFTVTLKTLTPTELETADNCWMREVDNEVHVSKDSGDRRKLTWIVALSLQSICGKPMPPGGVPMKDGKADLKALATARREILLEMGEVTMGRLIQTYTSFIYAIAATLNDPEGDYLKKP